MKRVKFVNIYLENGNLSFGTKVHPSEKVARKRASGHLFGVVKIVTVLKVV